MISALLDVPRCLNLAACYVGTPHAGIAASSGWQRAWPDPAPEAGTAVFRRRAVQECFDTAAVLRAYREPQPGETWLTPGASERRLLAQVHAILALGPGAVGQVASLAIDPDVPDPGRVFAALFVLGCVDGRAWLKPLRDTFVMAVARHPAEAAAAVEAVSLCPHPDVADCIEPLLADDRACLRAAAVRVLSYRGALTPSAWQAAMTDGDPGVLAAAASAPLRGYERDDCERALQPLLEHRLESIVRPALRGGLSRRLAAAHARAAEIARGSAHWAGAAHCLAMFGFLSDARLVRELIYGPQWPAGVRAAATLGSVALVPDLLDALERSDVSPPQSAEVWSALVAITGLRFDAAEGVAHARRLWSQHAPAFHADLRYRAGRAIDLRLLLQSLKAPAGLRSARQDIYLEMLAATESRVPRFSAYDFVGVQSASIRRIEQWLVDTPDRHGVSRLVH